MMTNRKQFSLFTASDPLSISIFRFVFGIVVFFFTFIHLSPSYLLSTFILPDHLFHFLWFQKLGLPVLPLDGLMVLSVAIQAMALFLALGIFYRLALFVMLGGYGYFLLLQKSIYSDQYYLVILFSLLMCFVNGNVFTLRNVSRRDLACNVRTFDVSVPYWQLWLLRLQGVIVLMFAGLSKLQGDWFHGRILKSIFMSFSYDLTPSLKTLLTVSLTSLTLLVEIGFALILMLGVRRRWFVVGTALYFIILQFLFDLGVYPWMMLAWLILFIDPGPARKILGWVSHSAQLQKQQESGWVKLLVTVYLIVQIAIPMRHILMRGDVNWTKQGSRFSWRILSDSSQGYAVFYVKDEMDSDFQEVPLLTGITIDSFREMSTHPAMIVDYARYLKEVYHRHGMINPVIRTDTFVSLNGRNYARLINPNIDLTEVKNPFDSRERIVLPHPDFGEVIDVPGENSGALFPAEYLLAVIDHGAPLKGDDPSVAHFGYLLDQLESVSPCTRGELRGIWIDYAQRNNLLGKASLIVGGRKMLSQLQGREWGSCDDVVKVLNL